MDHPLPHSQSFASICTITHSFLNQAHHFNTHSLSTYITKDVWHWRQNTLILQGEPRSGHLTLVRVSGLRDGGVLQSSSEAAWNLRVCPLLHIRLVFKGPQGQRSNLTNYPFSVLLKKLPHHSALKDQNMLFINPTTKTQSFRERPKSHPNSDTMEFSEAKPSQGKSSKSGCSSSWSHRQQMCFPGKQR